MTELMTIISVYERRSNRHKWSLLVERPVELLNEAITWAVVWRAQLDAKWKPLQLGYVIHEVPRCGQVRGNCSLKCNDPRVKRIHKEATK